MTAREAGGSVMVDTLTIGPPSVAGSVIRREAVRAVDAAGGHALLLRSLTEAAYAFPGGGVAPGEPDAVALAREVDEECGRDLLHLGPLVLVIVERRPAREPGCVFEMVNRYYRCHLSGTVRPPRHDAHELSLDLRVVWADVAVAVTANAAAALRPDCPEWVRREDAALRHLALP